MIVLYAIAQCIWGLPQTLVGLIVFAKRRADAGISYFSVYPERRANKLGKKITGDTSIGESV